MQQDANNGWRTEFSLIIVNVPAVGIGVRCCSGKLLSGPHCPKSMVAPGHFVKLMLSW